MSSWFDLSHFDPANLAYLFAFFGLLVKDILVLRMLVLSSHSTWLVIGLVTGNETTIVWHSIFVAINSVRSFQLFRARRKIQLPQELSSLWKEFFAAFTPQELLKLWNLGQESTFENSPLIEQDAPLDRLFFVLEGRAEVVRDGHNVSILDRGRFIGEMSFITGRGASATVKAQGKVRAKSWSFQDLKVLQSGAPAFWAKIQGLLGKDLVQKVYEHHINLK